MTTAGSPSLNRPTRTEDRSRIERASKVIRYALDRTRREEHCPTAMELRGVLCHLDRLLGDTNQQPSTGREE